MRLLKKKSKPNDWKRTDERSEGTRQIKLDLQNNPATGLVPKKYSIPEEFLEFYYRQFYTIADKMLKSGCIDIGNKDFMDDIILANINNALILLSKQRSTHINHTLHDISNIQQVKLNRLRHEQKIIEDALKALDNKYPDI